VGFVGRGFLPVVHGRVDGYKDRGRRLVEEVHDHRKRNVDPWDEKEGRNVQVALRPTSWRVVLRPTNRFAAGRHRRCIRWNN